MTNDDKYAKLKSKIVTAEEAATMIDIWHYMGLKVVFTNGCFDIVHFGHLNYLSRAANLGSRMVIGLNSDESVKKLKGETRPVQDEMSRAHMLASMFFVDAVVIFNEDTPYELIKTIRPDILVKGSDYTIDKIVGADIVLQNGGKVETMDYIEGYSTSNVINKIKGIQS